MYEYLASYYFVPIFFFSADTYHIKVSTNGSQYLRNYFWEADSIVDLKLVDEADLNINATGGDTVRMNLNFPENTDLITYYFAIIVSKH